MQNKLYIEFFGMMNLQEQSIVPYQAPMGFFVEKQSVILGQRPTSPPSPDIILGQAGVSRRQAKIFYSDENWYVEDLGSDNGTWLIEKDHFMLAEYGRPLLINNNALIAFGTVVARCTTCDIDKSS